MPKLLHEYSLAVQGSANCIVISERTWYAQMSLEDSFFPFPLPLILLLLKTTFFAYPVFLRTHTVCDKSDNNGLTAERLSSHRIGEKTCQHGAIVDLY